MKKYVLFLMLFGLGINVQAQLKISKVTISTTSENDMLKGMDFDYFNSLLPNEHGFDFRSEDFQDEKIQSMHCDNAGSKIEFTLTDASINWLEWRIGAQYVTDKIDAISYDNVMNDQMGNYVTFNSAFDEVGLQSSLMARMPLKFLNVYFGAGGNISKSFNSEICVFGSSDLTAADISFENVSDVRTDVLDDGYAFPSACFDAPSHLSTHLYIITGGSIVVLKHVELGMELYAGQGFRYSSEAKLKSAGLVGLDLRASILF